jgi:hypothetical protein
MVSLQLGAIAKINCCLAETLYTFRFKWLIDCFNPKLKALKLYSVTGLVPQKILLRDGDHQVLVSLHDALTSQPGVEARIYGPVNEVLLFI